MTDMVLDLEYFWAILLLFIMERICCLQEQFDRDFQILPDRQRSQESITSHLEDFANRDSNLKLSFLRLCRVMHVTMIFTLMYFGNTCIWFMMSKKAVPRALRYRFGVTIP